MKRYLAMTTALMLAASSLLTAAPSFAQSKGEIVIGLQCDRTGATQIVGTVLCPGFHDYIALVNSRGGVEGHMIKAIEIDHEYKVPPGVESYERHEKEGFQLKTCAVPPPGVEMGAQVLDIAQRYRADFVISHLFGGAPSVSIKELKRVGYPLKKVIGLVWASAEANIEGAGGFGVADGYHAMQFAGVGTDYPVLNEIRDMYKKQGKPAPKEMASTVFYNRGVLLAAVHVQAIR